LLRPSIDQAAKTSPACPGWSTSWVADHVDVIITQSYPAAAAAKEHAGKIRS
jgi:hypothetical protein